MNGGVCWRRGVNGVSVEMLFVAMFVVVLCTKITTAEEKRLTEASQPDKSHEFPLYNGFGLTTHGLVDISHLKTFILSIASILVFIS